MSNNIKIDPSRPMTHEYHAMQRISQALINKTTDLLISVTDLENKELSYDGHKHQNMARVYMTAAIMEIEKMMLAEGESMRKSILEANGGLENHAKAA